MPPKKTVYSLQTIAEEKVLYSVCEIILREIYFSEDDRWSVWTDEPPDLSVTLKLASEYLSENLSPCVLENILNQILSKEEAVEPTVRLIAIQMLLVNGVRNLVTSNFPSTYYSLVMQAAAKCGDGLTKLDLRGVWIHNYDNKFNMLRLLRKLTNIKHLTLRYNVDDEMLSALGKYCVRLEMIDISGSKNITEEGLINLCKSPNRVAVGQLSNSLKILKIGGPAALKISPEIVAIILKYIPKITSLGPYEYTGRAIEHVLKDNPDQIFGLRYMHDTLTGIQKYLLIKKSCPNLQSVYFDGPKSEVLEHLGWSKNLNEIKLNRIKWEDLKSMLAEIGKQLRSLFLLTVWGQIDLVKLGSLCPNLHRLEMHRVELICDDDHHETAFKNLVELYIYSTKISTYCIKLLLNQCINIEHLTLGQCMYLTDVSVINSLKEHALLKVREIWFGIATELTMETVQALIEHCPDLKSLGNLGQWNCYPDDLDFLRVQLFLNNCDLTLHEFGPQGDADEVVIAIAQ